LPLFRRSGRGDSAALQRAAIDAFWTWWSAEGQTLAGASVESGGSTEALVAAMAQRVRAIDDDLAWELSPGSTSRHVLTVTAAGVPELRAVARRWRMSAPPADHEWAYADLRLPWSGDVAELKLRVGDREYPVGEASVDAYVRGLAVDVSVHHPQFADLDERARNTVALLLLDQVLGEEDVETWVGQVGSSPVPSLDPVPLAGLRSVIRELRAQHTDDSGAPAYVLLQGEGPTGSPVLVMARLPLRPATAPHLDTYVGLAVPFADRTPEGLPGPASLERLRALEDDLAERLGDSGEIVAVQTHEGMRLLHVYVDGSTPAAEQLRTAALGWDQGAVRVESHHDPAWSEVRHLRGG
jgi:Family of unknown function (DUF695)